MKVPLPACSNWRRSYGAGRRGRAPLHRSRLPNHVGKRHCTWPGWPCGLSTVAQGRASCAGQHHCGALRRPCRLTGTTASKENNSDSACAGVLLLHGSTLVYGSLASLILFAHLSNRQSTAFLLFRMSSNPSSLCFSPSLSFSIMCCTPSNTSRRAYAPIGVHGGGAVLAVRGHSAGPRWLPPRRAS